MTRSIVRAADRFAIWREADAESQHQKAIDDLMAKSTPPTSTPPSGVEPPEAVGPAPEPVEVVVPNTNKFKYPASALGKILDTAMPPAENVPPHQHPVVKEYLDTPAGQGFSKTYLKPQYQEALKSHLGEQNYEKFLHHMPKEHHQALTTHAQAPAPKSNKFTLPANQLKKLLDNPKTTPAHVQKWKDSHEGFVKSYLHNPHYQQAVKGHLGEQNYDDWAEHLETKKQVKSDETDEYIQQLKEVGYPKAQPGTTPAQSKPTKAAPSQDLSPNHKLLNTFAQSNPDWAAQHGKTLQTPEFQQWFESQPLHYQDDAVLSPSKTMQDFAQVGQGPEPQGLGDKMKAALPDIKPALADLFNKYSPEQAQSFINTLSNPEKFQQIYDEHFGQEPTDQDEIGAIKEQMPGNTPAQPVLAGGKEHNPFPLHPQAKASWESDPAFKEWFKGQPAEQQQRYITENPGAAVQDYLKTTKPSTGNAPAQEPTPAGGEAEQHQVLSDAIKQIFPGHALDLDQMSVPEIKGQLENWKTHLSGTPGLESHIAQVEDLYDQHFGPGAIAAPQAAPSPEQQPEQTPIEQEIAKGPHPSQDKGFNQYLQENFPSFTGKSQGYWDDHPTALYNLQKKYQQEHQPAPTVSGPEFNDWWQDLSANEQGYYGKHPEEAQQDFLKGSKGPTHDQNLMDLADVMGSYQGGHSYVTDVPDYQAWEKGLSKQLAQDFLNDPSAAKADFEDFLTEYHEGSDEEYPEDDDEIAQIQQEMGGDPWAAAAEGEGALQDWEQQLMPQPEEPGPWEKEMAFDPKALAKDLHSVSGIPWNDIKLDSNTKWLDASPADAKAELLDYTTNPAFSPEEQAEYKAVYDKHFGGGGTAPAAYDKNGLLKDFGAIWGIGPGNPSYDDLAQASPEDAKALLQQKIKDWQVSGQSSDVSVKLQAVYDKHFGKETPAGTTAPPMSYQDALALVKKKYPYFDEDKNVKDLPSLKKKLNDWTSGLVSPMNAADAQEFLKQIGGGETAAPAGGKKTTYSDTGDFMEAVKNAFGLGTAQAWANGTPQQYASHLNGIALGGGDNGDKAKILQQEFKDYLGGGAPAAAPAAGGPKPYTDKAFIQWMKDKYQLPLSGVIKIVNESKPGGKFEHAGNIQDYLDEYNTTGGGKSVGQLLHDAIPAWDKADWFDQQSPEDQQELLKGWITTGGENAPLYQQLLDQHFGGGGQQPFDVDALNQDLDEIYGGAQEQLKGSPEKIKKELEGEFWLGDEGDSDDNLNALQAVYDKYFPNGALPAGSAPAPFDPDTFFEEVKKADPPYWSPGGYGYDSLVGSSPEEFKNKLDDLIHSGHNLPPQEVQIYQDLFDKYFGEGAGGGGAPAGGLTPDLIKQYFPDIGDDTLANWMKGNDPAAQKAHLEEQLPQFTGHSEVQAKWQAIYDQAFGGGAPAAAGGPAPFDADAILKGMQDADPEAFNDAWVNEVSQFSDPEEWHKANLKALIKQGENGDFPPEETAKYKALYQKYFGGGAAQQVAPAGYDGPPLAWIKEHYPTSNLAKGDEAGVQKWWEEKKKSLSPPVAVEAWLNDEHGDKAAYAGPGTGGGKPFDQKSFVQNMLDAGELKSAYKGLVTQDPQKFKENLDFVLTSMATGGPDFKPDDHGWGQVATAYQQQYGGGGAAAPPMLQTYDWSEFGPAFKEIYPKSEWATGSDPGLGAAQAKLKSAVESGLASFPDSDKTQQAKALYEKYFGPIEDDVTPIGGGNQPAQPPQYQQPPPLPPEPEEEEGVSAPAKSEQPDEEVLAGLTGANGEAPIKPANPGDWKDFAAWWGKTILTPEQEQAIYAAWFPNKNPEAASTWFQKVFDQYSKPSTGDLTAQGMPAWASAGWALGANAEQEWPVFQQWAAKDAGIPKNTSIKQKLAIWKGLSTADKKEIAENYLPANPVDTGAVAGALQQAFPDSDWSKWATMPQGILKTNVELLAKSGYPEAIPIFNQFFGGSIPVPEPTGEKAVEKPAFELKTVPPSKLPEWVKDHWGDTDAEAKRYTEFKHFADSVGAGELAEKDYQGPIIKLWNQLPQYLKTQVNAMPQPPWSDATGFTEWVEQQPKIADQLTAITGQDFNNYPFSQPTNQSYSKTQSRSLGNMIEAEPDPAKQQALLGVYNYYFGNGNTTLSQALTAVYPDEDWDKLLKGSPTKKVMSNLVKRMKTEQDPEKWIQLVDIWNKYFPHPDFSNKPAPTGVKQISQHLKDYANPGNAVNPQFLKALKYWKEQGGTASYVPYYGHIPADYDPGPYIQSQLASKDENTYAAYHGWTPPGAAAGEGFKSDPAMLGSTGPTYAAPAAEAKGQQYQTLMDTAKQHKADTPTGGGLSPKDIGVLGSEDFQHWWNRASKGYKEVYQTHPSIALGDFHEFMAGGQPYPAVPGGEGPISKQKPYDPGGPGMLPTGPQGHKGLPPEQTLNPPRSERVKFPEVAPTPGQETLPLGAGEGFAPQTAPLPIYRLMRLKLDEDPEAPSWVKGSKAKEQHVQQQKARLRRIDEIINGKAAARKFQDDHQDFEYFASNHGLDDEAKDQLEMELFAPKQGDLFSDDKWAYFADFAKKHNIDPNEMHDLAQKVEVMPPPETKGNYDHPELAQLILDYLENGGGVGETGVGTHWTRDRDKAHFGIPAGGVFGPEKMKSTYRQVPLLMHGLWSGRGETGSAEGGAYSPHDPKEVEQNLRHNAPIFIHRLQIRGPEGGPHRDDWHDVMDHIPVSLLPEGPNETVSDVSGAYGSGLPKRLIRDKASLAQTLQETLGGGAKKNESDWSYAKKDWDHLKPGYQADAMFNELVGKLGPHPEQTHPKELARIRRIYEEFFVGKPDLPTKPHTRRASMTPIERLARFNDMEYRQHVNALDQALEDHFARGHDTAHAHGIVGGDGVTRWSPARLARQRRAVDRAWQELGGDTIPQEGKAMLLGGVPGSGKGDLYRHPLLGLQDYLRIDPDYMKQVMAKEGMIPAIPGHSPMESSPLAHREASELATRLAERAYRQGRNVVWDTTLGNHRSTTDTINRLRNSGYHTVDAALMSTDPQIARQRAEARHRTDEDDFRDGIGQGGGGRWVPSSVSHRNMAPTLGRGYRSAPEEVFDNVKHKFDNVAEFNGDTTPATLTKTTGPSWGQPDDASAELPALTATGATQGPTVRSLLESYERGELSFEQLVATLTTADYTAKPEPRDLAEAYHHASFHPDDNDFFWVDSAHDRGVLTDAQRQQITAAIDTHHQGGNRLAVVENEIRILEAGIEDLPEHLKKPHWLDDYAGYGQVPGEIQDRWADWLNMLTPEEIEKFSDPEKYGNQGKAQDYSDEYENYWANWLEEMGVKPNWEYGDDDEEEPDDEEPDDEDDEDNFFEDDDEEDFEGNPPRPEGDRPAGWPTSAPWVKGPGGEMQQYFPPGGLNPESTSHARPETDWEMAEHEQDPLPMSSDESYRQTWNEWPHDPESIPLYRGFALRLDRDRDKGDPFGQLRRSLWGGRFESGEDSPSGNKNIARPHPLGFDNPALGEHILDLLKTNTIKPKSKHPDLGRHWTTDENIAHTYALENTGGGSEPLYLPVKVRAQWKGLGEDPYRANTAGHWPEESEITMTKGAPMDIASVQIRHPHTGEWHEVLDQPTQRAAAHRTFKEYADTRWPGLVPGTGSSKDIQDLIDGMGEQVVGDMITDYNHTMMHEHEHKATVRRPRGILTMRERLGL